LAHEHVGSEFTRPGRMEQDQLGKHT